MVLLEKDALYNARAIAERLRSRMAKIRLPALSFIFNPRLICYLLLFLLKAVFLLVFTVLSEIIFVF